MQFSALEHTEHYAKLHFIIMSLYVGAGAGGGTSGKEKRTNTRIIGKRNENGLKVIINNENIWPFSVLNSKCMKFYEHLKFIKYFFFLAFASSFSTFPIESVYETRIIEEENKKKQIISEQKNWYAEQYKGFSQLYTDFIQQYVPNLSLRYRSFCLPLFPFKHRHSAYMDCVQKKTTVHRRAHTIVQQI